MILQALVAEYEDLHSQNRIASPGWGVAKVSYVLYLLEDGTIFQVVPLLVEEQRGKKTVLSPRTIRVPAPVKRSSQVAARFLCDNAEFMLGIGSNSERTAACFQACRELHQKILADIDDPAAHALLQFFSTWDPASARENPFVLEYWDSLISGVNLVFGFHEQFLQDIPCIASAWEQYYLNQSDAPEGVCLVTGKKGPIQAVHPSIKGIRNAHLAGAVLVSNNTQSSTSFAKKRSYNAPVSQYAAFAYTTALNYMISDRNHIFYAGDTAVICWAAGAEPAYQGLALGLLDFPAAYAEQDLLEKAKHLVQGDPVEFESTRLDPNRPFYVLGLAPNAARLSVRFFWQGCFGDYVQHIAAHHERMNIVRPKNDNYPVLPLGKLLSETVNQKVKDKSPSPVMAGELLRSILQDSRYPATILNSITLRIRAEHQITRGKAALIKAYYLKNTHPDVPKEVLQVSLNPDSTNVPYNLGRLFSILENIQSAANPTINTTIRDKYFSSASATPAMVFPVLINLAQKHLAKIGGGLQVVLEKSLQEVMGKIGEEFPSRLNLAQQGAFQLGYYHQTQARYQGKAKEES